MGPTVDSVAKPFELFLVLSQWVDLPNFKQCLIKVFHLCWPKAEPKFFYKPGPRHQLPFFLISSVKTLPLLVGFALQVERRQLHFLFIGSGLVIKELLHSANLFGRIAPCKN